jgi:glutaminyl-tRNA synthetase
MSEAPPVTQSNFIRQIIDGDIEAGRVKDQVVTRFPPEPNGYLHIGHAKSICLNFGLARDYLGRCHLRFDDTNPVKEDVEYVSSILEDVRWLGFDWGKHLYYASDYFEQLYAWALELVRDGKAFVCDLGADEVRNTRGTLVEPGIPSPWRDRTIAENLDLFQRMRAGEFPDGSRTLRARIDMSASNLNLRDPVLYRILHASHHRTGNAWCIYPMYDWAHGQSDAIEGITHSICTLEFEDHRPLYDWFLDNVRAPSRPHQIEFARLNLNYTVMSKRVLLELVKGGHVQGWDDPRMPTIAGLRRRGFTPASIREFSERIGVAKADSMVDMGLLESCVRDDLGPNTPRVSCVHRPLKVVLTNWPEGEVRELEIPFHPDQPERFGSRNVPLSREIYIEQDDFDLAPPKGFFRLSPGSEVRLRQACIIRCNEVVTDASTGAPVELRCTADRDTFTGPPADGRKVKGIVHWVSAAHAVPVIIRLYDRLFRVEDPMVVPEGQSFLDTMNPDSLLEIHSALAEPSLASAKPQERYQFERKGYYFVDPKDSKPGAPVFHRIVTLKDAWARQQAAKARV